MKIVAINIIASQQPNCATLLLVPVTKLFSAEPQGPGSAACIFTCLSILLIMATLPFSLCLCIKVSFTTSIPIILMTSVQVVQEYERAVIFRLGRLRKGGAKERFITKLRLRTFLSRQI